MVISSAVPVPVSCSRIKVMTFIVSCSVGPQVFNIFPWEWTLLLENDMIIGWIHLVGGQQTNQRASCCDFSQKKGKKNNESIHFENVTGAAR